MVGHIKAGFQGIFSPRDDLSERNLTEFRG
jgi:hypothetical protein